MNHTSISGRRLNSAVFIDYDNLFDTLERRGYDRPEQEIKAMLHGLIRSMTGDESVAIVSSRAYADYSTLPDGQAIQQQLVRLGCVTRYTDTATQPHGVELQLCIDAVRMCESSTADMFIFVSGSRFYIPLLQELRCQGRHVRLVSLEKPGPRSLSGLERDSFLDANRLLDASPGRRDSEASATVVEPVDRSDVEYHPVTSSCGLETLQIVEDYFGQYDEVYLTPLLRKLSAVLDEDPKVVIADLEDHGAVWLEKRQGFPYDYTVLIVDTSHPDVERLRSERPVDDEEEHADGEAEFRRNGNGNRDISVVRDEAGKAVLEE